MGSYWEACGVAGLICLGVCIVTGLCIILPLSLSYLDAHEWGIEYNKNTQSIDLNNVKEMGRYWPGPGVDFIKYPRNVKLVEYSKGEGAQIPDGLFCWTLSGQLVFLEMSFFYQIQPEKLVQFYFEFGEDFEPFLIRYAHAKIKDTTPKFVIRDFFEKRETIRSAINKTIADYIYQSTGGAVKVTDFLLRAVDLPEDYAAAITTKLVARQKVITANSTQFLMKTQAQIDQVWVNSNNTVVGIQADATANGTQHAMRAEADAWLTLLQSESKTWKKARDDLGLSNNELLYYAWLRTIQEFGQRQETDLNVVIGFNNPTFTFTGKN